MPEQALQAVILAPPLAGAFLGGHFFLSSRLEVTCASKTTAKAKLSFIAQV